MSLLRKVKKGQTLLYQGEVPSGIYQVKNGLVRAYNVTPGGEEKTIALYAAGDYFPAGFLFDNSPVALFYYDVVLDAEVEIFSKDDFKERLIAENPWKSLAHLSTHYVSSLLQINALTQTRARDRVIHMLQFLALRFGSSLIGGVFTKIDVPLTQHDMAKLCGQTRETVSAELTKLKKEGIVAVRRKYYTVHLKKLRTIIGEELDSLRL